MKTNRLAKWALLSVLILSAGAVTATDITWGNSAGNTDWLSGASWSGGNVPGSNDVAVFPASTAVPVAQPTLNGTTNINALLYNSMNSSANSWQILGSGTLTIMGSPGTSGYGIRISAQSFETKIYPNLVLGGPQTWWYDLQSGNPFMYLYGTLSGAGPLTKFGRFPITYANNTAPTFTGGLVVTNSDVAAGRGGIVQWSLTNLTAASNWSFGPGAITLDGGFSGKAGFGFQAARPTAGTTYTQTLDNAIVVGPNGGFLSGDHPAAANTWLPMAFGGPVTLKGPLLLTGGTVPGLTATRLAGTVTLDRSGASTKGIYLGFDSGIGGNDYGVVGWDVMAIEDSASGPFGAPPLVLRSRVGAGLTLRGAANSYAGGTVVEFSGDTARNIPNPGGAVYVSATAKLGTGDVLVMPGGRLGLGANACIASGKTLRLESTPNIASAVVLPSTGVPTALTSDSEGILAIAEGPAFSTALDLATVGNGRMFLGNQWNSATYSATSLLPGVGNVYRLGGGFPINSGVNVLYLSSSALSLADVGGASALQVGRDGYGGNGIVRLYGNNTFSGELRVVGQWMADDMSSLSELQGSARTGAGQSPFGAATGNVRLQHGGLRLYGVSGGQTVNKGVLTFEGVGVVAVDATAAPGPYPTRIEFDSLVRTNRGVLVVDAVRNSAQVNEKVIVTNGAPTMTNGVLPPWFIARNGDTHNLATYDAVNGFGKYSGYVAMPTPGMGTEVVSHSGAVSGSHSIWALVAAGAITDGGSGAITINGGHLLLAGNIAPNLDFGSAEGVVFSVFAGVGSSALTGKISGNGGLTLAGGGIRLGNAGNDFSGQITIANATRIGFPGCMVMAEFDTLPATTRALGNADNDILLNGGALGNFSSAGNALLASRTVTLGPLGGYLVGASSLPFTIYGPVIGDGFLVLHATGQGNYGPPNVTLDAAGNTYSGGTRVCGWLTVNAGSSVGKGPVMLHYGSATFKGNANISTNARLQVCLDTKAYFQSAAPAVGSLVGAGKVQLGTTGVDTTLTVGQDNSDCAFLGEISQFAGRTGSVVKEGSGTWTLHGRHLYTGATTVSAGALKLRGSLAGGLTVGSGGTLAVDLGPDGASYGAVAGAVTLGGVLTLNIADGYQPAVGQSWTMIGGASGYSGGFSSVSPAGYKAAASGGDLVLTRIPSGTVFILR